MILKNAQGYRIANDTPVWFKRRRTVWFILDPAGKVVIGASGRNRYFKTPAAAAKAMSRIIPTLPQQTS